MDRVMIREPEDLHKIQIAPTGSLDTHISLICSKYGLRLYAAVFVFFKHH
jgi:hypothetical protein